MITLYHKTSRQKYNCRRFETIMARFPDLEFYHPSYDTAPWHVQCRIGGEVYNFWPHLMKGNKNGEAAYSTYMRVYQLVEDAVRRAASTGFPVSLP